MPTIVAGENLLLSLVVNDSNGDPVPAADIMAVSIELFQDGVSKVIWSSNGSTPSNMQISNGLIKLEIPGSKTKNLAYQITARVAITFTEASMFYSGGEVEIMCLDDLFEVLKC